MPIPYDKREKSPGLGQTNKGIFKFCKNFDLFFLHILSDYLSAKHMGPAANWPTGLVGQF